MPTFETPEPISVSLDLVVANVRIAATDRSDTVVEVLPSDPDAESDVAAAGQTRVDYANGRLAIKAPKGWKQYSPRGGRESIDVRIELPAGSHVRGEAGVASLSSTGRLGEFRYKTGVGDISLHQASPVRVRTGAGDISVDRAGEHAEVVTGAGAVRVGAIDGTAVVKNSNGDTWIGVITGDLRVNGANGNIGVGQAQATVAAKTAQGSIRLREVTAGAVVAETAFGKIDIDIADGVAAWLDLHTRFGHVQNTLDAADRPVAGEEVVEVRASTSFGDITIGRAPADAGDDVAKEDA